MTLSAALGAADDAWDRALHAVQDTGALMDLIGAHGEYYDLTAALTAAEPPRRTLRATLRRVRGRVEAARLRIPAGQDAGAGAAVDELAAALDLCAVGLLAREARALEGNAVMMRHVALLGWKTALKDTGYVERARAPAGKNAELTVYQNPSNGKATILLETDGRWVAFYPGIVDGERTESFKG